MTANMLIAEGSGVTNVVISEHLRVAVPIDSMVGICKIESCCKRNLDEDVTVEHDLGFRFINFQTGKRLRLIDEKQVADAYDVLGAAADAELWPVVFRGGAE